MSDSYYSLPENPSRPSNEVSESVLLRPEMTSIFESLSNDHRRLVLVLLKHGRIETKADVIDSEEVESEGLDIALEHRHLPKLAESGYIEWDRETGEISKGERFEEVEALLELIETRSHELPSEWR